MAAKSIQLASKFYKARRVVAQAARSTVELLEPRQLLSSVVTTFAVPSPNAADFYGSGGIVAGPDGNYWFADTSDNSIGKVTPAGQVTLFPLHVHNVPDDDGTGDSSPDDPEPLDIVVGPNGNLWFTESGVDRIGEITPGGTITEFETPSSDSYPEGLAVGSDGNLWFAETGNNIIGKITPDGRITEYPLSTLQTYDDGLVEGADGKIWFIADDQNDDGVIASITPDGTVTSYSLDQDSGTVDPTALAAGPDGNLWVGTDTGTLERVSTAGAVTGTFSLPSGDSVTSISPGTNNTLWLALTGNGNDQFGSVTTGGVISTFELPSTSADSANANIYMSDLIEGAGGTLWFADNNTPQVGTIDLTRALLASSDDLSVTAGTPQTSTFTSFVDFSGAGDASDYTATIALSDGTTLTGSVAANASGGFDVTATNTWPIASETAVVTITDTRDSTRIATATDPVYGTAPTATGTGVDVSATAGVAFTGTVATFTGVALNSLSSYSATIDWGDGHSTAGTITANSDNGVDISGSNTYAVSGTYSVTTSLLPYPTSIGVIDPPIRTMPYLPIIFDPGNPTAPISKIIGAPVAATGGSGVVTSSGGESGLTSTAVPVGTSASFSGTINSINTGSVKLTGATLGAISTPIAIAPEPIISILGNGSATATSTASVAAGVMSGTGYSVTASSTASFNGVVADFTLADPGADLSHFHATVQWTDPGIANWFYQLSNAPSAGVITPDGNGGFTVSTSTNFASGGLYHFVVTITDDRLGTGSAAQVGVAYGQVVVDSPIVWLPIAFSGLATPTAAGVKTTTPVVSAASDPVLSEQVKSTSVSIKAGAGKLWSGAVGHLSGITTAAGLSGLHGTIHWGDGTTSPATLDLLKGGRVTIAGSHTFADSGTDAITIDLTQSLNSNGKPSSLYPRLLPTVESAARVSAPVITQGGIQETAEVNTPFTGPLASFAAPSSAGSTETATIAWGDGKKSTGASTYSNGTLTLSGTHTYRKAGKYKVSSF